jgi:hypothetical protein
MRSVRNVEHNCAIGDGRGLAGGQREKPQMAAQFLSGLIASLKEPRCPSAVGSRASHEAMELEISYVEANVGCSRDIGSLRVPRLRTGGSRL